MVYTAADRGSPFIRHLPTFAEQGWRSRRPDNMALLTLTKRHLEALQLPSRILTLSPMNTYEASRTRA